MDKVIPAVLIVLVVVAVFALMAMGWRARRRRQADLAQPASPPSEIGTVLVRDDLFYVATTRADAPLDRIAVAGLGFRARAVVTVTDSGVVLELAGRGPAYIPAADIRKVTRATWTIDRVVNADGLVVLTWMLGETAVDSYLRSGDPATLIAALQPLAPASIRKDS